MVKAGRNYVREHFRRQRLARKWVAVGQSQGGAAAISAARYAAALGGRGLDYRGAAATGVGGNFEPLYSLAGPNVPVPLPGTALAIGAYFFTSLDYVHPELGLDGILTPLGQLASERAKTECLTEFANSLEGVNGNFACSRPVASLPGWKETATE